MYRFQGLIYALQDRWDNASPTDFGALALAVVITVWFVNRYCSN